VLQLLNAKLSLIAELQTVILKIQKQQKKFQKVAKDIFSLIQMINKLLNFYKLMELFILIKYKYLCQKSIHQIQTGMSF
jgi:hypothetical protein